jgi:hypothetical protein
MVRVISCKITGSELCSDAWEDMAPGIEGCPEGVFVAQSHMIVEGEISVYAAGAFDAEEEEDDDAVKVNDIVSKFQLQQCEGLGKKDFKAMFMTHVKAVMKAGKLKKAAKESEEGKAALAKFQEGCKSALTFFLKNFKDCDIYMNEDQAADGAYVVGWWNADAEVTDAPQMMFWLGGCDFRKM